MKLDWVITNSQWSKNFGTKYSLGVCEHWLMKFFNPVLSLLLVQYQSDYTCSLITWLSIYLKFKINNCFLRQASLFNNKMPTLFTKWAFIEEGSSNPCNFYSELFRVCMWSKCNIISGNVHWQEVNRHCRNMWWYVMICDQLPISQVKNYKANSPSMNYWQFALYVWSAMKIMVSVCLKSEAFIPNPSLLQTCCVPL